MIDNPSQGKKGCLWGIVFIIVGIVLYDSIGGILLLIGIILVIYGKIKHWFYN